MRQLIAGNWKMNGLSAAASHLAGAIRAGAPGLPCDLLLCPPFTQLASVAGILRGSVVGVGGQDCHAAPGGAHTGDISAEMLADLGCSAVILGHSERRQHHQETDEIVRAKIRAAVRAGLTPIVCVGETEAQRQSGDHLSVVAAQLAGSLPNDFAGIIAYEPIWAIGTGQTATNADVESMHRHIRATLIAQLGQSAATLRILYGGSVKPENAGLLLAVPEVGGALVGGASLHPDQFLAIAAAAVDGERKC